MTAFRRFVRLVATILRPWFVALALLAITDAAFMQRQVATEEFSGPAGLDFAVKASDSPHWRSLMFDWRAPTPPSTSEGWVEGGGWGGLSIHQGRQGNFQPWQLPFQPPPPPRPPTAAPDYVVVQIGLLWYSGLPAIASVVGVWLMFRAQRNEMDTANAGRGAGLLWRLTRPWVCTFAPVGIVLLAFSGTFREFSFLPNWAFDQMEAEFVAAGPETFPTRILEVSGLRRHFESHGDVPDPSDDDWRWTRESLGVRTVGSSGRLPMGVDAMHTLTWTVSLSVWWLVAVPAACNLATLARLARRLGTGRSV